MSLVPIVYPAVDQQGVETSPVLTALFSQAMETGSFELYPPVLITQVGDSLTNDIKNIAVTVSSKRIDLTTLDEVSTIDIGGGVDSGEKYRTLLEITPSIPLDPNNLYSVILPKNMSLLSVFDPEEAIGNSSPIIVSQGPFNGFSADTYTITITDTGSQSRANYSWTRASDGHSEDGLRARRRFIEMDRGVMLRFPDGDYTAGDSFTIKVIPAQLQGELYTWNFETGAHDSATPEDTHSTSSISLPINYSTSVGTSGDFSVDSIEPQLAGSLIPVGKQAIASIGGIAVITNEKTSIYNTKTIEIVDGAVAGSETITMIEDIITITIALGTTLNQAVMDLINNSVLGADLLASSLMPLSLAALCEAKAFSTGVERNKIVLTFSKNIDASSINNDTIKVFTEGLLTYDRTDMKVTHEVSNNVLTIQIED